MGFLISPAPVITSPTTGILGADHSNTDSHVHREPVPWVFGRARLPILWLGEAWGQRAEPVRVKSGKKKITTGYRYYASCAGACCAGPITELLAIYVDGEAAWSGPLSWSGDSADITVEGRGQLRIYRGSWTQQLDASLAASGHVHYPYRGLCYVIMLDWLFGENRTGAPNIEVVVRRLPAVPQMSVSAGVGDGANPAHCIADILTDNILGLGVPADRIDWTSFDAVAAWCVARGLQADGALTNYTRAATAVAQLLQWVGARLTWRAGLLRMDIPVEIGDTDPVIGPGSYIEQPSIQWHGWAETIGSVTVRFADERAGFQDGELTVTLQERQGRAETLDAPWIARQDLAYRLAAARARERGVPWSTGHVTVHRAVADQLHPGDGFWLDARQAGLMLPARVTSIAIDNPWSASATIEWEEDRALASDQAYLPPADPAIGQPPQAPAQLSDARLVEAHWGLFETDEPRLVVLAARGDLRTDRIIVHQLTSGGYREVTSVEEFAWVGQISSPIPEGGGAVIPVQLTLTGGDRTLISPSVEEARQLQAVALIDGEWFTWWGPTPTGQDTYTIQMRRSAWGSPRQSHAAGAKVWLLLLAPGAKPPALPFKRFATTLNVTMKLQPSMAGRAIPLEDVPPITITMVGAARRPPTPIGVLVNGVRSPWWNRSAPITVSWRFASWDRLVRNDLSSTSTFGQSAIIQLIVNGNPVKSWTSGSTTLTISAFDLLLAVGGNDTFIIRIAARYGTAVSEPEDILVHAP